MRNSENSIDSGIIFQPPPDIDAAFCLGGMVWGPFSEAVELGFRSTHEEHMKRKIIHLAEKKLIPTD